MKIVQVMASSGGIGGLETHTFNLAGELARQHEVHLIAHPCYAESIAASVIFHPIDFSRSRWNPVLLWQLFQLIQQIQPNVVHAQGGKASKTIAFLSHFFKVPTVATVHGMKNHLKDYLGFNEVIAVSPKVAEKIQAYRSVHMIYNGVRWQAHNERPTIWRPKVNPKKALAVGRLETVKGFDRLIYAWQGIDLELDILGEGSEKQRLQQLIEHLHLQDKIKLRGFKANIHLDLLHCDFVVISSLKEGGPLVVAEALLQHVPVIATDVGMVRDFIPEQYIAKSHQVEALHDLIQATIQRFDDLPQDFASAFLKAEQSLTLDAMSLKTLQVYRQCC